eukprot:TRINITY_DN49275_c0_g1_i1.p1 TRINITY_DN49275_c0_g1~~TRINITY_DN49275_c0_g1_i1.p1  ORF type:complete len:653 (+),score=48.72 TRINITY_DN49275_c0_g1_i1:163-2121(+)
MTTAPGDCVEHKITDRSLTSASPCDDSSRPCKAETSIHRDEGMRSMHTTNPMNDMMCRFRSLPSKVDLGMLRATPVSEVLSGFGRHFSGNAAKASDYKLSKSVDEIDDFISHDWRTGRVQKVITLCYIYNRYPAFIASFIAAIPLGLLGSRSDDEGTMARYSCPFIWLTFFFFWQRMRSLFRRPRFAFLDKLCIHQTDPEQKTEGILGLAGFLGASQRMVVLWSPHYFQRLWCTYELAAWCHLHGMESDRMELFSVPAATLQFLLTAVLALKNVMGAVLFQLGVPGMAPSVLAGFVVTPFFLRLPNVVSDMVKLPRQLETYRIHEAKCFCCTHDHLHPETSEELFCDRELIYQTLQKWTADELSSREPSAISGLERSSTFCSVDEALHDYDKIVQHSLQTMISRRVNTRLVISDYKDCVLTAAPTWWSCCDFCGWLWYKGEYHAFIRWLIEYTTPPLFLLPLALFVAVQCAGRLETPPKETSAVQTKTPWVLPSCSWLFIMLVYFGVLWFLWLPGLLMHELGLPDMVSDALMLLRYALLALATMYVLRTDKEVPTDFEAHAASTAGLFAAADATGGGCLQSTASSGVCSGEVTPPNGHHRMKVSSAQRSSAPDTYDLEDEILALDEIVVSPSVVSPRTSVMSNDSGDSLCSL